MNDLDLVTLVQGPGRIVCAGDDLPVHLDGDPALLETELSHQVGEREALRQLLCLTVDDHAHAATLVVSLRLYNVGTIW